MSIKNFSKEQFEKLFCDIIEQKISAQDIKKILLEINLEPFSAALFLGARHALKKYMKKINAPKDVIDVCGTGGDNLGTLNISTAVCLAVAACGVVVAKHGNRAISSKSGSADIFSALKVPILEDVAQIEKNLREKKICFLYAPFFHEALKNIAQIRKEIAQEFGVATIFNYLGPLLNPANTQIQLIGTAKKETMLPMLEALKIDGARRVYIAHGFDGMDEITICNNSYLLKLENGKISEEIVDPSDFGFRKTSLERLKGKDPQYNAQKMLALFGGEKSSYRDIVLLNAGFALQLASRVADAKEGITLAQKAIDDGDVLRLIENL